MVLNCLLMASRKDKEGAKGLGDPRIAGGRAMTVRYGESVVRWGETSKRGAGKGRNP